MDSLAFQFLKETEHFCRIYPNGVTLLQSDDSMKPQFFFGDIVCGIPYFCDEISAHCLEKVCIVQTCDKIKLLRYVRKGSQEGLFFLGTTNPEFAIDAFETSLEYAAPVVWHRLTQ